MGACAGGVPAADGAVDGAGGALLWAGKMVGAGECRPGTDEEAATARQWLPGRAKRVVDAGGGRCELATDGAQGVCEQGGGRCENRATARRVQMTVAGGPGRARTREQWSRDNNHYAPR